VAKKMALACSSSKGCAMAVPAPVGLTAVCTKNVPATVFGAAAGAATAAAPRPLASAVSNPMSAHCPIIFEPRM
jgi:hypothetical protein